MGCSLRLQRFCCCCSLRTGTLIIGTLGWLDSLFQIFVIPGSMQLHDDEFRYSEKQAAIDSSLYIRISVCLISLLVSVLLVVGVHKKKNTFMLAWLVLHCLKSIGVLLGSVICFGVIFYVDSRLTGYIIVIAIVIFLVGLLDWYCWICVWSHYKELNDRNAMVSPNVQYSPTDVSPPPFTKAGAPLV